MPLYEINNRRPEIGEGTWIAPSAELIGDVRVGKNCYIGFGAILRGDYGTIFIGDESAIEEGVTIHARPRTRPRSEDASPLATTRCSTPAPSRIPASSA